MNRCLSDFSPALQTYKRRFAVLAAMGVLAVCSQAWAQQNPMQTVRPFPPATQRGVMVITQPPELIMNEKADRLSPGARIRSASNMLVMSGSLIGQKYVVNYLREPGGMVHEVWILTDAEAALKLPTQK